jgi:hypothetical protein
MQLLTKENKSNPEYPEQYIPPACRESDKLFSKIKTVLIIAAQMNG